MYEAGAAAYFDGLAAQLEDNHGAWALPDGEAFYAFQVKRHTPCFQTGHS